MSARQQAAVYGEALARVKGHLHRQVRKGRTEVSIGEILDLIEPDGEWARQSLTDAQREAWDRGDEDWQQAIDPRADPITGCLPVTAE